MRRANALACKPRTRRSPLESSVHMTQGHSIQGIVNLLLGLVCVLSGWACSTTHLQLGDAGADAPRQASTGGGAVREREAEGVVYLGNGLVEVGVACATGKVSSLRDLQSRHQWLDRPVFPLALSMADTSDVWRAEASTLERAVGSIPAHCRIVDDLAGRAIEVVFNDLARPGGRLAVATTYHVAVDPQSREIRWGLTLKNNSDKVIVEAFFPVLTQLSKLADAELVRPHMAGLRARVAELNTVVREHFPHLLSMPWFDLGTAADGIYLASLDPQPHSVWLYFMDSDRHGNTLLADEGWTLALGHLPFSAPGTQWSAPEAVVMPHQGGWHTAAGAYRMFYQENFAPITISPYLRRLSALSSAHLKTPWGVLNGYDPSRGFDAVFDFKGSHEYTDRGIRGLRLDGWQEAGYDTFVPGHPPLEELGGERAFAAMVARATQENLQIYPYLNPRLVNVDDTLIDDYQRGNSALREQCAVRQPDGSAYRETYGSRGYGEHTGLVMCLACAPWRDHFEQIGLRLINESKVPGLYLDQFALGIENGLLCYNKEHGHATPAEVWGQAAVDIAARLHRAGRARNPNFLMFMEGNFDRLFPYIDLPFSWSDEPRFLPNDGSRRAPEVLRYTFNNIGTQKMYSHGTSAGADLALMIGNVLDSGGHDIRLIQARVPEVFFDGHFTDTVGILSMPANAARVVGFRGADRFAIGVLSNTASSAALTVTMSTLR